MILTDFLQRFEGVKEDGRGYKALCPAHPDRNPSLSISEGDNGRIIIYCHAGCTCQDVLAAVDCTEADLFNDSAEKDFKPSKKPAKTGTRTEEARYQYYDLEGHYVATKIRYRYTNGKKSFEWIVEGGGKRPSPFPFLYNWYQAKDVKTVFFVEGEKDVDTLTRLKLPAVSIPDGAKKPGQTQTWHNEWTDYFNGKTVVIIPDNDEPGRALKQCCVNHIFDGAAAVKVLDLKKIWADIPEHGDVTDYIKKAGGTSAALVELVKSTPKLQSKRDYSEYKSTTAAELQRAELPEVKYLVNDILPEGTTLIAAPSKIGKSWFVLDMGLSIAMGRTFMSRNTTPHNVLYLALEDSLKRLQNRMNKILAGDIAPSNFYFWTNAPRLDGGLIEVLTDFSKEHDIKLIIVDTLQKIRGANQKNEGAYDKDYREMGELKRFADDNHVSLFFVHHTRKMKDDDDSFNMISGTNGIMGAADTAFTLIKDKRDSENATLHITGRDVAQISDVVHFDKSVWKWIRVGDFQELQKLKHRASHNADPVVQTILELVTTQGSWKGRMGDLMLEGERITGGDIADSPRQLGSHVCNISNSLAFYNNISVDITKNGSGGKIYSFRKVINGVSLDINDTNDKTVDETELIDMNKIDNL